MTNPYASPSATKEDPAKAMPAARPSPTSPLSLLSTVWVIGMVLTSIAIIAGLRLGILMGLGEIPYILFRTMLVLQGLILGFWVAAGYGPILVRMVLGVLLFSGIYLQAHLFGLFMVDDISNGFAGGIAVTAAFDFFLSLFRGKNVGRALLGLLVKLGFASVVFVVLVDVLRSLRYGNTLGTSTMSMEEQGLASLTLGALIAAAGVLLLVRKHGLGRRWVIVGFGIFLLAPLVVTVLSVLSGLSTDQALFTGIVLFLAVSIAALTLHASQQMLRSWGLALVSVPPANASTEVAATHEKPAEK